MINTGLHWLCLRPCWYLLDLSQQYCFKNKGVFTFPCAKNSWQVTDVSVFCCLVLFFLRDQLNFHQDGPSILVPIYTVLFFLSPIYFRLMGLMFKWFGMLNKRVPVGAPFWTFDIFTLIWSHVDPEAHWQFEPYSTICCVLGATSCSLVPQPSQWQSYVIPWICTFYFTNVQ